MPAGRAVTPQPYVPDSTVDPRPDYQLRPGHAG